MIVIQVILLLFILSVVFSVIFKFKRKEISAKEFVFWIFLWASVLVAVIYPHTTDKIAKIVGVGRGADLLIYISIFVLFFIIFKIFVKLEKIERNITKIVRKIALDEGKNRDEVGKN